MENEQWQWCQLIKLKRSFIYSVANDITHWLIKLYHWWDLHIHHSYLHRINIVIDGNNMMIIIIIKLVSSVELKWIMANRSIVVMSRFQCESHLVIFTQWRRYLDDSKLISISITCQSWSVCVCARNLFSPQQPKKKLTIYKCQKTIYSISITEHHHHHHRCGLTKIWFLFCCLDVLF